ncbi:protein phosphatase 1 regulatory subunit 3C-like isoform X2 [Heterodontus francisci]
MPVDIALTLCLSHSPPIHSFLNYQEFRGVNRCRLKPLRPCLHQKRNVCVATEAQEACDGSNTEKKKVVFADAKGFSLTAVRVFSEFEEDLSELQFELSDLADCVPQPVNKKKLSLDFPQPAADYLNFRSRLQKNFVCLESCTIQETSISGTVKVKNLGYEKKVKVRTTFDSWKSFQDVECAYLNDLYACRDTDTFSFQVDLPKDLQSCEKIEFCVSFECGQHTYWDNNSEENYRITCMGWQSSGEKVFFQEDSSHHIGEKTQEVDFEQFGSPRSVNVIFSQWQSWGRFDSAGYW